MSNKLPDAVMKAWEPDSLEKLGCWMQLAGIDPVEQFKGGSVKDHPWIGLEVKFPFPEYGKGKILSCLIHPRGYLMFDLFFQEPVPPIQGYPGHYEVVLKDDRRYYDQWKRFPAQELKELCEVV